MLAKKYNNVCAYCFKNHGDIYILCKTCKDLKLCVKCFAFGVEGTRHRKTHAYSVQASTGKILKSKEPHEWDLAETITLLKAIEVHHFTDWKDIAAHFVEREPWECKHHYLKRVLPVIPARKSSSSLVDLSTDQLPTIFSKHDKIPVDILPRLGFMPKRDEFEFEFDNAAEQLVSSYHPLHQSTSADRKKLTKTSPQESSLSVAEEEEEGDSSDFEALDNSMQAVILDIYNARLAQRKRAHTIAYSHDLLLRLLPQAFADHVDTPREEHPVGQQEKPHEGDAVTVPPKANKGAADNDSGVGLGSSSTDCSSSVSSYQSSAVTNVKRGRPPNALKRLSAQAKSRFSRGVSPHKKKTPVKMTSPEHDQVGALTGSSSKRRRRHKRSMTKLWSQSNIRRMARERALKALSTPIKVKLQRVDREKNQDPATLINSKSIHPSLKPMLQFMSNQEGEEFFKALNRERILRIEIGSMLKDHKQDEAQHSSETYNANPQRRLFIADDLVVNEDKSLPAPSGIYASFRGGAKMVATGLINRLKAKCNLLPTTVEEELISDCPGARYLEPSRRTTPRVAALLTGHD